MNLTPRQHVERALRGGHSSSVPFTIYEYKVYPCTAERTMRNRGMCIVNRHVPVVRTHHPNVTVREEVFYREGKRLVRAHYQTPVGELTTLVEPQQYTSWVHEKMFKSTDDYKALLFYLQDVQYEPCYASFLRQQEDLGEDVILRSSFGLEPLQSLISGSLLGMEDFCEQWMENRDELLTLYQAIVDKHRLLYPLVAQSPVGHANYGGNVVQELIGPETFAKYYVPHYNEAAQVMHRHGKLVGCHFDDDCSLIADQIAATELDYVEAFTPAPDSDMTVAQARAAWPNKVLWLNFPSSQHLKSPAEIERITYDLTQQAGSPDGFLMGITEDMPLERWQANCLAIMDGLQRHSRENPGFYA